MVIESIMLFYANTHV